MKQPRITPFAIAATSFLLASPARAANYTVKAAGGGDFVSIQACASKSPALSPGDSCTVYAGTYDEVVTLSQPGNPTAPITFKVNPGDTVKVYGFVVSADDNTVEGFYITDPTLSHAIAGVYFPDPRTGDRILDNTITQVGSQPCIRVTASGPISHAVFSGNDISWCASVPGQSNPNATTAVTVYGDHILAENNKISHAPNGIATNGSYNVLRGNSYGPVDDATDFPGCHELDGCDTHVDFVETGAGLTHLLIEDNYEHDILGVGGAHAWLMQATGAAYAITRFNTIYNIGSGYLLADSGGFTDIKDYNNTIAVACTQASETAISGFMNAAIRGAYLNDVMYDVFMGNSPLGQSEEYYFVDSTSVTGFTSGHNLAWDTACSPATLANCTYGLMNTDPGNVYANPLFVNPAADWSLQPGSAALNAGAQLTTVASNDSGSGTSLAVDDAGFFQDGFGFVQADWIAVGTVSNTVPIASIDYSTNVITLAVAITRHAGDPVWLAKDSAGRTVLVGSAPNIGSYVPSSVGRGGSDGGTGNSSGTASGSGGATTGPDDAGTNAAAGPADDGNGCGCRVVAESPSDAPLGWGAGAAVLCVWVRRRRRK